MANKKIILSQKQLDEIVGGNTAYLDNLDNDFVKNGNNEVYTGEKMDDKDAKPVTTDKIAKMKSLEYGPWMPDGRGGSKGSLDYSNHMITCSKKEWAKKNLVSEINSNLANRKNFGGENGKTYDTASVEKARYNRFVAMTNSTDPEVKKRGVTGKQNMEKNNPNIVQIINSYDNARTVDKNLRQSAMERGEQNKFQREGGTKTTGNGQAHTTKNGGIITYNN